jgi:hypothetical protein
VPDISDEQASHLQHSEAAAPAEATQAFTAQAEVNAAASPTPAAESPAPTVPDISDEQASHLQHSEAAAPAGAITQASTAQAEVNVGASPTPAGKSPTPIGPDTFNEESEPVRSTKRARISVTSAALDQRRSSLKRFVDAFREAREYKLSYEEIAILAHRRNRSAIDKYLSGNASDQCTRNVEDVLKMVPEEVDAQCKQHAQKLPKLHAHLVRLRLA